MRSLVTMFPLLGGCLLAPSPEAPILGPGDPEPVVEAFTLLHPAQSLAFLDDPALWLPFDEACPIVRPTEAGGERWEGDCALADGTLVLGSLERFAGLEREWVAGEGLRVLDPTGAVVLELDGAVELIPSGDLLAIGANFTACGLVRSCEDGPATVDLGLTLFPYSGYPQRFDLAVEGAVASPTLDATAVSGAISFDLDACGVEPASGSLLVHGDFAWSLDFDGAVACDGCAEAAFEGLPVGPGCASWLAW